MSLKSSAHFFGYESLAILTAVTCGSDDVVVPNLSIVSDEP